MHHGTESPHPVIADRYELTHRLGIGGMGDVWAAHDRVLLRPVALKFLRRDAVSAPGAGPLARFRREAQLTARIDHPAVPVVHDLGTDGDISYLVIELVDGQSLDQVLEQNGPLDPPAAATLALQICDALATAHRAGVVHRDLKPSNVMLDPEGRVRLLDFGVALSTAPLDSRLTATGSGLGSVRYAAPEQHLLRRDVDHRCDLYALGCLLHELLAGQPPFAGTGDQSLTQEHLYAPPPPLRRMRSDTPPGLERLVLDLLAKKPGDRPPSAEVVAARLAAFVHQSHAGGPAAGGPSAFHAAGPPPDALTPTALMTAEIRHTLQRRACSAHLAENHRLALPDLRRLAADAHGTLGPAAEQSLDLGLMLAVSWSALGEPQQAEVCLRSLLAAAPDESPQYREAEFLLGTVLHAERRTEGAELLRREHTRLVREHGSDDLESRELDRLLRY
ncbi:serine/threonine-protein kinase [Streptomyces sp. NPDC001835]|uniref:serine/threonine-protein kinase n=1 Tax=unclassified Streptomyces TaxID=2593676 RepID=UPI0033184DFB